MKGQQEKKDPDAELERPKIYVRRNGALYLKPSEVLRSKSGLRRVKEMADFAEKQMRSRKKSKESA